MAGRRPPRAAGLEEAELNPARWRCPRCCALSPSCWPRPGSRAAVSVPPRAGRPDPPGCGSQGEPSPAGAGGGCAPGLSGSDLRRPVSRSPRLPPPPAPRQPPPTLLPVPSDPSGSRRMDFESLLLQTREKETFPGALLSAHPRDVGGSPKPGLALLVAQGELLGLSVAA